MKTVQKEQIHLCEMFVTFKFFKPFKYIQFVVKINTQDTTSYLSLDTGFKPI